jgi:hypothetical protein
MTAHADHSYVEQFGLKTGNIKYFFKTKKQLQITGNPANIAF